MATDDIMPTNPYVDPSVTPEMRLKAAFKLFDTDGSGTLSASELLRILTRPGQSALTLADAEEVIKKVDVNGDGELDVEEFVTLMTNPGELADVKMKGSVYEGQRNAAGKPEGYGKCRFANGNVYEGQFKAGKKEGHGKLTYAYGVGGGAVFEGEFKDNDREGPGTMRYNDGMVKVGFYKLNKAAGEGVKWEADGATAWQTTDGKEHTKIDITETQKVLEKLGLELPSGLPPLAWKRNIW